MVEVCPAPSPWLSSGRCCRGQARRMCRSGWWWPPLISVWLRAWANYDVERHNDARWLWPMALSVAPKADTARAMDLTVQLLLAMTHQALYLRRAREGLGFAQPGHDIVANGSRSLLAATASSLACHQA